MYMSETSGSTSLRIPFGAYGLPHVMTLDHYILKNYFLKQSNHDANSVWHSPMLSSPFLNRYSLGCVTLLPWPYIFFAYMVKFLRLLTASIWSTIIPQSYPSQRNYPIAWLLFVAYPCNFQRTMSTLSRFPLRSEGRSSATFTLYNRFIVCFAASNLNILLLPFLFVMLLMPIHHNVAPRNAF